MPLSQVLEYEVRYPLDALKAAEPETIAQLTEEIREQGITEPIVIRIREDGSAVVWDGLHRLIVARDLGIENIPVTYIGATELRLRERLSEAELERLDAERMLFETIQEITEPLVGRASYEAALTQLDGQFSSLLSSLMKDLYVTEGVTKATSNIFDAIKREDPKALKSAIALLQLEVGKAPSVSVQIEAGEQVKLLGTYAEDVLRQFMRKVAPEAIVVEGITVDYKSWQTDRVRQIAERLIERRLEKFTEKLPSYVAKRSSAEIMEYLRERYDADYFETYYEGEYKDLDDFLDVDRAESEIKKEAERDEDLAARQRDIEIHEIEKKNTDRFREAKPSKVLDDRSTVLERQIEEKKKALEVAEREKLVIPMEEVRELKGEEVPALVEERALAERAAEAERKEEIARRVEKAKEALAREKMTEEELAAEIAAKEAAAEETAAMTKEEFAERFKESIRPGTELSAAYLRMTSAQFDRLHIEPAYKEYLESLEKAAEKVSVAEKAAIRAGVSAKQAVQLGVDAYAREMALYATHAQAQLALQLAVQQAMQLQPALVTQQAVQLATQIAIQPALAVEPAVEPAIEPVIPIAPVTPVPPVVPITPTEPIIPLVVPFIPLPSAEIQLKEAYRKGLPILILRYGSLHGKDVWKAVIEPATQVNLLTVVGTEKLPVTPRKYATGKGSAKKTMQWLGKPPGYAGSADLGIVDVYWGAKEGEIHFKGGGLKTVAGTRMSSTTKGISIPRVGTQEVPLGVRGLKLGTSLEQLLIGEYGTEAQKGFGERALSLHLSKMTPEEIAEEIRDVVLPESRVEEILSHLPSRVGTSVKGLLKRKYAMLPIKAAPSERRQRAMEEEALSRREPVRRKAKKAAPKRERLLEPLVVRLL